jgi:hypothetical protein
MAIHMIVQISHFVGAAFAPYVSECFTKFLPLISNKHIAYADIRSYAIESLAQVGVSSLFCSVSSVCVTQLPLVVLFVCVASCRR